MYHLSRDSRRLANAAGLRKSYGMTRRCPNCGAELLWEQDEHGMYVAMGYKSYPHVPHMLTCQNPVKFA